MVAPLQQVLSRWELDPPRFDFYDLTASVGSLLRELEGAGALLPAPSAGSWDCIDCGTHCRLVHLDDVRGARRVYAACARCGPVEVPAGQLERLEIDSRALLTAVFASIRVALEPIDSRGFWRVGRAHWGDRSREVWFVRGSNVEVIAAVESTLVTHGRACLFTPTRDSTRRWTTRLDCTVIALEDVLDWDDGFQLDDDVIEGRLSDFRMKEEQPKLLPKRATRAAAIEALRQEINAHIVAAADYAFETESRTGTPELLPKPTQAELAARIGVSAPTLGRCLADKSAPELKLLWDAADDVYEVMKWKHLAKRKR